MVCRVNQDSGFPDGAKELRERIIQSLQTQGFRIKQNAIMPHGKLSKDQLRDLHATAVSHRIARSKEGLIRKEGKLLEYIASGNEIEPARISPRLIEVLPSSEEELLFRYASLHWSIPVSSGYGRRLRFLVLDDQNGKLIGLIGLGDPVYNLGPRDRWIGWDPSGRRERLRNVMDAFVLGAVPPYSLLLCGKLVAMLITSDTVRDAIKRKYGGTSSLISGRFHDGSLALITTTSALGRSSVYNRLRLGGRLLYKSVGFTKGSGEFHFSNGLYDQITQFVQDHTKPTEKQERWGTGFRSRREIVKKCLSAVGLSRDWLYHGIEREIFVVPLASNTREFLRGEVPNLEWQCLSENEIFDHFRDRWLSSRASWDTRFRSWAKEEWMIWSKRGDAHG